MSEGLKQCPHCGCTDIIRTDTKDFCHHVAEIYITCPECGMRGPYKGVESSGDAWNALPRRLRWTKEKPTKNGWFFHRDVDEHGGSYTTVLYWDKNLTIDTGLWAGPIPEPEEE